MKPEKYNGRLVCHRVDDNSFSAVENDAFDFFFSFGVFCHNPSGQILEILTNALPKMKVGGIAVHEYGDWEKLDSFGWKRGEIPEKFKEMSDDDIMWPRNNRKQMSDLASRAGWTVVNEDLGLLQRDGLTCLRRDACSLKSASPTKRSAA